MEPPTKLVVLVDAQYAPLQQAFLIQFEAKDAFVVGRDLASLFRQIRTKTELEMVSSFEIQKKNLSLVGRVPTSWVQQLR